MTLGFIPYSNYFIIWYIFCISLVLDILVERGYGYGLDSINFAQNGAKNALFYLFDSRNTWCMVGFVISEI